MSWLLRFIPKNYLSYFVGQLVHIELPKPIRVWAIQKFSKIYKINTSEAEFPVEHYKSIGDFFVRKLKLNSRPIAAAEVVHPADSALTQIGEIHEGKLIQAKGKFYNICDFTKDNQAIKKFEGGLFATYYLCPMDYHRVHSPIEGKIISVTHIPGKLWPVNAWSVEKIKNLFSINERVAVTIQTDKGDVVLVFVGATNVGKIELTFDSKIISNDLKHRTIRKKNYDPAVVVKKGQELGLFHMGSTVVMLYPKTYKELIGLHKCMRHCGCKIKMGEALS